jgi:cell wall-associated protease
MLKKYIILLGIPLAINGHARVGDKPLSKEAGLHQLFEQSNTYKFLSETQRMNMLRMKQSNLLNLEFSQTQIFKRNAKGTILESYNSFGTPENWFNLSPTEEDEIQGVSTNKAYAEFGTPKSKDIIVAVIDSGVDVNHEDLQGKIWINDDEIPGNGQDDDNNGYVDDVFGWNFIGARDGMATIKENPLLENGYELIAGDESKQVHGDTYEATREVVRLKKKQSIMAQNGLTLSPSEKELLDKLEKETTEKRNSHLRSLRQYEEAKVNYLKNEKILKEAGLEQIDYETVSEFPVNPTDETLVMAKKEMIELLEAGMNLNNIISSIKWHDIQANYWYNTESDTRKSIVKDNYADPFERDYGNNDVTGPTASHGTHVAGIIAAKRNNDKGIDGVATNVKIMAIRAVPDGDERDKDIANAILYAVENGAHIINMSFGKSFSPHKTAVDLAVQKAMAKGVLLVHAAGNSYGDNDLKTIYPNKVMASGKSKASNWITVGASTLRKGTSLAAGFSNYGKTTVDIFAPGVNILSTFPDDEYNTSSGTSMAAPVVSGVAALLLSHDDSMKPQKVKDVLFQSARKFPELKVYKARVGKVLFSDLSVHGGIVDAYEAIKSIQKIQNTPVPRRRGRFFRRLLGSTN